MGKFKIIPFNNRILVKRRKVGEKVGSEGLIYAPDQTADAPTDLADVVYVPELTFADKEIIDNAEFYVKSLSEKIKLGESEAMISLLRLNEFLKIKSIKAGDAVMIGKYVGTDFNTSDSREQLTLVLDTDIIGLIKKEDG